MSVQGHYNYLQMFTVSQFLYLSNFSVQQFRGGTNPPFSPSHQFLEDKKEGGGGRTCRTKTNQTEPYQRPYTICYEGTKETSDENNFTGSSGRHSGLNGSGSGSNRWSNNELWSDLSSKPCNQFVFFTSSLSSIAS